MLFFTFELLAYRAFSQILFVTLVLSLLNKSIQMERPLLQLTLAYAAQSCLEGNIPVVNNHYACSHELHLGAQIEIFLMVLVSVKSHDDVWDTT